MSKIYTVNVGNTNTSIATFTRGKLDAVASLETHFQQDPKDLADAPYALSKVKEVPDKLSTVETLSFSHFWREQSFLDMPITYAKTIGEDRLYQSYYLFKKIKSNELNLLIDVGTFVTVDFITKKRHHGGYIMQGPDLLARSFAQGRQLNPISWPLSRQDDIPSTTQGAMEQSCVLTYTGYLKEILLKATSLSKVINIHLTGGAATHLESIIDDVFPRSMITISPNLIHYALHELSLIDTAQARKQ